MDLPSHPWWLLALALIGAVTLVSVLITLFTSIGEAESSASLTTPCQVDSLDFLLGLAGTLNAPLQRGGTARLLDNGDRYVPAILDAIRGAERTVNLMTYIWEPGEMSDRMFDALVERARAGVEVRVLLDGLGGHKAPDERIQELRRAGGRWEWFHPPRFGKLTRFHKRNHRRAILVDGRIGFTGGAAVADKWLGDAQDAEHWRDSMVEVRGCLAVNLQSVFAQLWSHVTGELLTGPYFFPPDSEAEKAVDGGEEISHHVNVVSSPSNESHPLRRLFWLTFRAACRTVYVTNPYFVPDRMMREVLVERARAGVDVRVLVPNEHNDVPLIRWASHRHYEQLLEAGVRIYEYQPTMIHQKTLVVDGRWSVVGSANLDVRSKELNQENVLGILDTGFARQLEQSFFADLERAREVRLEEWRRRPFRHRVRERFFAVFEEQF